jgi:hypothetical protein
MAITAVTPRTRIVAYTFPHPTHEQWTAILVQETTYPLTRVRANDFSHYYPRRGLVEEIYPLTRVHARTTSRYFAEDREMERDVAVEELSTLALTAVDSVVVRRQTDESKASRKRWWRRVFGRRRKREKEEEIGVGEEVVDMPNYRTI